MPREIGPGIEAVKLDQRRRMNAWRDQAASAPVTLNGARYDADPPARTNLSAMAIALASGAAPDPIYWRDADDITRSLTHAEFMTLATTVLGQVQAAYQVSFVLKDEIESATTTAAVRAIHWDATPSA